MSKKNAKPIPTEPAPAAQPDDAMRLKACLVGLESVQQDWLTAIARAADTGLIEITAAGQLCHLAKSLAAAARRQKAI